MMKKIAIIGTGISGLSAAWLLHKKYDITVYEKNNYIGGHTNTQTIQRDGLQATADTGFMVFNHETYPNMVKLFELLGVQYVKTVMTFGIQTKNPFFEFCSDHVFVQWKNAFRPKYWRMLQDIVTFNKKVEDYVADQSEDCTLDDVIKGLDLSEEFTDKYLLPMAGSIWSTHKENMRDYSAVSLITFLRNHGLLMPKSFDPRKVKQAGLQWYTVTGGASTYVEKLIEPFRSRIRVSCSVREVRRVDGGVHVLEKYGKKERYDDVIFASHPGQTLDVLADADDTERELLSAFRYSQHNVVLHGDISFMMSKEQYWPSWTYREEKEGQSRYELSYNMNRLQHIQRELPAIVTLDPMKDIREEDVYYRIQYEHPLFSVDTEKAQKAIAKSQGKRNTWHCGAWLGYGFHEDGLKSALHVARHFDVQPPWKAHY
jgi:predicted NAD/FAD-binding protein